MSKTRHSHFSEDTKKQNLLKKLKKVHSKADLSRKKLKSVEKYYAESAKQYA